MNSFAVILNENYQMGSRPVFDGRHCVNAGALGVSCDRCTKLCPEGIYPDGRSKHPDFTKCVRCGICSASCPSAAITPVDTRVRAFMMALAKRDRISVGCPLDEERWSLQLDCLAGLSWEQVACAALRNGIILSVRKCGDCPRRGCAEQIAGTLDRVRRFLGEGLFSEAVTVLEPGDPYTYGGAEISRRELLTFFRHIPLDEALDLLPELGESGRGSLFYRGLLRDLVQERYASASREKRERFCVELPLVNDRCYGCGLCVRQCPEKALDIRKGEESFAVTVDVWRCTACGICADVCREKAIDGTGGMTVPHLGRVIAKKCRVYRCTDCGKIRKPGSPDGLCDLCRIRRQTAGKRSNAAPESEAQERKDGGQ